MKWSFVGRRHRPGRSGLLVAMVGVFLAGAPATAQDRLVLGPTEVVSSGPAFGATIGPSGALEGDLAAGGRFGLLFDHLIETATGRRIDYPFPSVWYPVAADPARARGFFTRARTPGFGEVDSVVMADLTTGALTPVVPVTSPPGRQTDTTARVAVDAGLLFVSRPGSDPAIGEMVVVDPAIGPSSLRVLPVPPVLQFSTSWTVTPDGTRLLRSDGGGTTAALVAYDVETGAELSRRSLPAGILSWSDALDGAILVRELDLNGSRETEFTLVNRDLQVLATARVPTWGKCGPARLAASARSHRVYTFTGDGSIYSVPFQSRLTGVTPGQPGMDVADVDAAIKVNCVTLRVVSPPAAPRQFRAQVTGAQVALGWQNVGSASRFALDVGFAPGRTDLQVALGPDSRVSFAGVPAGTYYVRLRGGNAFGTGEWSPELQVRVP